MKKTVDFIQNKKYDKKVASRDSDLKHHTNFVEVDNYSSLCYDSKVETNDSNCSLKTEQNKAPTF
jgi:hypothetical protein